MKKFLTKMLKTLRKFINQMKAIFKNDLNFKFESFIKNYFIL